MYKVFVKDVPILLSTEKFVGKQYTAFPLKWARLKKIIKKINKGKLTHVNLYHKNEEKLERLLRKKMPVVEAAGGLVYNAQQDVLFIYRNKRWDLPKGRVEKNENFPEAAIREVEEETGVKNLTINRFLQKTYHVFKRNGKFKLKITYWYEMQTSYTGTLVPQQKEGITKAVWKNFENSQQALQDAYENIKLLFPEMYFKAKALNVLEEIK